MAKKNIYEGGSGLAAKDKVGVRRVPFIAHTIDKKHNQRVRVWTYKPVACWRLNEICFAFDSCFLSPETADALTLLRVRYPAGDEIINLSRDGIYSFFKRLSKKAGFRARPLRVPPGCMSASGMFPSGVPSPTRTRRVPSGL